MAKNETIGLVASFKTAGEKNLSRRMANVTIIDTAPGMTQGMVNWVGESFHDNETDGTGRWLKLIESVNLRTLFEKTNGRGPEAGEKIIFTIPNDVVLISSVRRVPAITIGSWLATNEVIIENNGWIMGRGGNVPRIDQADRRREGGDAISNPNNAKVIIRNKNWIAGGGGAGGTGSGSAGAPFGKYIRINYEIVPAEEIDSNYLSNRDIIAGFRNPGVPQYLSDINRWGGTGGKWGDKGSPSIWHTPAPGHVAGKALDGDFIIESNTGRIRGSDYPNG